MDSTSSSFYAEFYMKNFEYKILVNSNPFNKVFKWLRYVDYMFCICTGTERQANQFLMYRNKINCNI